MRLPAWVKVVLTSRPQVEAMFKGWAPERIAPGSTQNMADMEELLRHRLAGGRYVADEGREAAVQLLLRKSQVGGGACTRMLHRPVVLPY